MRKAMHMPRAILAFAAAAAVALAMAPDAGAQQEPEQQIARMATKAMESFDALEYEQAKKLLNRALVVAETNNVETDPVVARVYINLGILSFNADPPDPDAARLHFIKAVKIDATVEIDAVYSTPEMREMLETVRDKYGDLEAGPRVDCGALSGLEHTRLDSAAAGKDRRVQAHLGLDINAAKMSVHYRMYGIDGASPDFVEIQMNVEGNCKYTAVIPGSKIKPGGVVHYYIAAYSGRGRVLANNGSDKSPNIMDVIKSTSGENPLGTGDDVVTGPVNQAKFYAAAKPGTGGAFVTGRTEGNAPINCCFAPALLHIWLEGGYYLSPQLSVGGAIRLGFPFNANVDGAASTALAGLARLRYAMSQSGSGLIISAAAGFGVVRQTVKLEDVLDTNMDTDTSAIGPFLVGGGMGYTRSLGGPVHLAAEADVTTAIPIVDKLGDARLNFGIQFDFNLGVIVAF